MFSQPSEMNEIVDIDFQRNIITYIWIKYLRVVVDLLHSTKSSPLKHTHWGRKEISWQGRCVFDDQLGILHEIAQ